MQEDLFSTCEDIFCKPVLEEVLESIRLFNSSVDWSLLLNFLVALPVEQKQDMALNDEILEILKTQEKPAQKLAELKLLKQEQEQEQEQEKNRINQLSTTNMQSAILSMAERGAAAEAITRRVEEKIVSSTHPKAAPASLAEPANNQNNPSAANATPAQKGKRPAATLNGGIFPKATRGRSGIPGANDSLDTLRELKRTGPITNS